MPRFAGVLPEALHDQKAFQAPGHPRPRVITVDGNPSYPKVIAELKEILGLQTE